MTRQVGLVGQEEEPADEAREHGIEGEGVERGRERLHGGTVESAALDGRHREERSLVVAERVDAGGEHCVERGRQHVCLDVAAQVAVPGGELLEEERHAVGELDGLGADVLVEVRSGGGQEPPRGEWRQRVEPDHLGLVECGEPRRDILGELRPGQRDDEHRAPGERRHVPDQIEERRGSPVDVVHREHQRVLRRDCFECAPERPGDLVVGRLRLAGAERGGDALRDGPGMRVVGQERTHPRLGLQSAGEPFDELTQRPECGLVAGRTATADRDGCTCGGTVEELLDEARLSDPRGPHHDPQDAVAAALRFVERPLERTQLKLPVDEPRSRRPIERRRLVEPGQHECLAQWFGRRAVGDERSCLRIEDDRAGRSRSREADRPLRHVSPTPDGAVGVHDREDVAARERDPRPQPVRRQVRGEGQCRPSGPEGVVFSRCRGPEDEERRSAVHALNCGFVAGCDLVEPSPDGSLRLEQPVGVPEQLAREDGNAGAARACSRRRRLARRLGRRELRRVHEDRALELAERLARGEAELVESVARHPILRKRVGLAPAPVQREHQQLPETLLEWMIVHEGFQLGNDVHVPSAPEIDVEPLDERPKAELLKPCAVRRSGTLELDVGQRRPVPQLERAPQVVRRGVEVAGRSGRPAACVQPRELRHVDRPAVEHEPIAQRHRRESLVPERPSKP